MKKIGVFLSVLSLIVGCSSAVKPIIETSEGGRDIAQEDYYTTFDFKNDVLTLASEAFSKGDCPDFERRFQSRGMKHVTLVFMNLTLQKKGFDTRDLKETLREMVRGSGSTVQTAETLGKDPEVKRLLKDLAVSGPHYDFVVSSPQGRAFLWFGPYSNESFRCVNLD